MQGLPGLVDSQAPKALVRTAIARLLEGFETRFEPGLIVFDWLGAERYHADRTEAGHSFNIFEVGREVVAQLDAWHPQMQKRGMLGVPSSIQDGMFSKVTRQERALDCLSAVACRRNIDLV
jgi:hypothetical protein